MFALKGVGKNRFILKIAAKQTENALVLFCNVHFFGDLILTCFSTRGMYQHHQHIMFFLKGTCFGLVVPMHLKLLFLIILDMFF